MGHLQGHQADFEVWVLQALPQAWQPRRHQVLPPVSAVLLMQRTKRLTGLQQLQFALEWAALVGVAVAHCPVVAGKHKVTAS